MTRVVCVTQQSQFWQTPETTSDFYEGLQAIAACQALHLI